MNNVVATLHRAMAETAGLVRGELSATAAAFEAVGLGSGARLAAIASAVAAWTATRHAGAPSAFLGRIRAMTRPAAGFARQGGGRADGVEEGVRVIAAGLGRVVEKLTEAGIDAETCAVVESVLLSRLLAVHRPYAIREALDAAQAALAKPGYRPGEPVMGELAIECPAPLPARAG